MAPLLRDNTWRANYCAFLYIDECLEAVRRLMASDFIGPVNIGSEEMVEIEEEQQVRYN